MIKNKARKKSKEKPIPLYKQRLSRKKQWQLRIRFWKQLMLSRMLAGVSLVLIVFLSIYSYVFKKKGNESWLHWLCIYIHIYIFTTDPLDLNIQINTKTTKIALFCRNIVGLWYAQPPWDACENFPWKAFALTCGYPRLVFLISHLLKGSTFLWFFFFKKYFRSYKCLTGLVKLRWAWQSNSCFC